MKLNFVEFVKMITKSLYPERIKRLLLKHLLALNHKKELLQTTKAMA